LPEFFEIFLKFGDRPPVSFSIKRVNWGQTSVQVLIFLIMLTALTIEEGFLWL
jgi:hypothetical protein